MFTIYTSDAYQQESNCVYPHSVEVVDEASFKRAVSHDHVCAKYKNNYRGNQNFISSDCLPVDCDNDHSDDPADWKTPADIRKALPGVFFAVHYSRHNNRPKDGKSARPRFHLFFQIDPMTDYEAYAALKQLLHEIFPYLDANALDAARFLYGTRDPQVEFHPGGKTLTDFLYGDEFDKDMPGGYEKEATIPEGSRNTTMFRWAVRSMKRYGDTEESKNAYFMQAEKCQPPLSTDELNHIWKSAQKYYAKIASQPGYVSPQEYNNPNPGWDEPLPFSRYTMAPFPVDALPEPIADYVKAVAESTQTSCRHGRLDRHIRSLDLPSEEVPDSGQIRLGGALEHLCDRHRTAFGKEVIGPASHAAAGQRLRGRIQQDQRRGGRGRTHAEARAGTQAEGPRGEGRQRHRRPGGAGAHRAGGRRLRGDKPAAALRGRHHNREARLRHSQQPRPRLFDLQ
jgi:hypothetical protein